jgi:hypothetical protein
VALLPKTSAKVNNFPIKKHCLLEIFK